MVKGISKRIKCVKIRIQERVNMLIIQVYTPTLDAEETQKKIPQKLKAIKENSSGWNGRVYGIGKKEKKIKNKEAGCLNILGVKIDEEYLKNLRFVDDTVLIAKSTEQLEKLVNWTR